MAKGQRQTERAQARVGEKYGLLTITEWLGSNKSRCAVYRFACACGNTCDRALTNVKAGGQYASCGCSSNVGCALHHMKHGQSMRGAETPEYRVWQAMIKRCAPGSAQADAKWYAEKGIRVCDRWKQFEHFFADMGKRPGRGYDIDRIDPNGNYEPGNCRWLSSKENRQRSCAERFDRERKVLFSPEKVAHVQALAAAGMSIKGITRQEKHSAATIKRMLAGEVHT